MRLCCRRCAAWSPTCDLARDSRRTRTAVCTSAVRSPVDYCLISRFWVDNWDRAIVHDRPLVQGSIKFGAHPFVSVTFKAGRSWIGVPKIPCNSVQKLSLLDSLHLFGFLAVQTFWWSDLSMFTFPWYTGIHTMPWSEASYHRLKRD